MLAQGRVTYVSHIDGISDYLKRENNNLQHPVFLPSGSEHYCKHQVVRHDLRPGNNLSKTLLTPVNSRNQAIKGLRINKFTGYCIARMRQHFE